VVAPTSGAAPRTTHLGKPTLVLYSTFVYICELAGIAATNLDFGRAGPGCGPVKLVSCPQVSGCVLGLSNLELAAPEALFEDNPVLRVLENFFNGAAESSERSSAVIIVDLKCVFRYLALYVRFIVVVAVSCE
jgi:hypothetical protein